MIEKGIILSDFNVENLALLLKNNYSFEISTLPHGTVHNWLIAKKSKEEIKDIDFIIVWTRIESVISLFNRKLNGSDIKLNLIFKEVDEFCSLLLSQKVNHIFLPLWHLPNNYGNNINDLKNGGIQNILNKINLRMIDNLENQKRFTFLNTNNWIIKLGEKSFDEKSWYLAKIPYSINLFKIAAELIILDLDDTLWGGIVGDIGWKALALGGHDPKGEAFVDFQNELKTLKKKGYVLAIVSKNEENTALNAIKKHPEMRLKIDDFVTWRINWEDKAENIIEIVEELNIGINSVVFIDDNPLERARVKEALPEVKVIELPKDKMLYKKTLLEQSCFDKNEISEEDLQKTELFIVEKKRKELKNKLSSVKDWLRSIDIKVECSDFKNHDIERVVQLINKTNQMNLSTRRLTDLDLTIWLSNKKRKLWTFRVSDKFGDSGLVGIVSTEIINGECNIIDFILSCRVFGREIENIMIYKVIEYCLVNKMNTLKAVYKKTQKNKPCLDFLLSTKFRKENNIFTLDISENKKFNKPNFIKLINTP